LFADRITPYSEHARVRTFVTPIVPQVSGRVVELAVDFSQVVDAGDLLFKIDQQDYQVALDEAQAAFDQVVQDVGASGARLEGGQADVVIYTGNNYPLNAIAWLQIRLMSLLSYLY
jgi:multidrug resistance efflux pump